MTRFLVPLVASASRVVEVEADSKDQAIDAASREGVPILCHACASNMDLGDFIADEESVEVLS